MTTQATLQELIESEVADFFSVVVNLNTEFGGASNAEEAQIELTERLCKLLTAHEQEPVAWRCLRNGPFAYVVTLAKSVADDWERKGWPMMPLYTHPALSIPAVVPESVDSRELFEKWCPTNLERNKWHPEFYAHLPAREQWAAWEAGRASILKGYKP